MLQPAFLSVLNLKLHQCTQENHVLLLPQIHPTILDHFPWDQIYCAKIYSARLIQSSLESAEIFKLISVGFGIGPY